MRYKIVTLDKLGLRMTNGAGAPGEDVEARAARLDITVERVLEEYRRIAFASIHDIAAWDSGGLRVRPSGDLGPDEVAAIAEIVASASTGEIYRIKMHDKKPVLDALGRFLRMQPTRTGSQENQENEEDPVDFIIKEFDRMAAEAGQGSTGPGADEPQAEGRSGG